MNILTSISALFDVLFVRWNVSPYLLHIGHFAVRWYGILFITGFILGYWMFTKFYKAEALPLKLLDPMLYMLLICALVGARLGHIIFYEPHYYFVEHPEEILKVWHGGLASHGGAIAILFGVWWYVHKYGKQYHFDFYVGYGQTRDSCSFCGYVYQAWKSYEFRDIRCYNFSSLGLYF
jgi:phosphatidylglycerol:prolipoprotein diacylglycerol transferase